MTAAPTVVSTTSTINQPLQPDVPIFGTAAAGEPTQHVEVGAVASPNLSDTPTEMIPSSPDPLNTLSPSTLPLPPVPAQAVLDPTVLAGMPTPDPAVLAGMPSPVPVAAAVAAMPAPQLASIPTPAPAPVLNPSVIASMPAAPVLDPTVLAGMPAPDPAVLAGMPVAAPM